MNDQKYYIPEPATHMEYITNGVMPSWVVTNWITGTNGHRAIQSYDPMPIWTMPYYPPPQPATVIHTNVIQIQVVTAPAHDPIQNSARDMGALLGVIFLVGFFAGFVLGQWRPR